MSESKVRVRVSGVPDGPAVNVTVAVYPRTNDEFAAVVARVGVTQFRAVGNFVFADVDGGTVHLFAPPLSDGHPRRSPEEEFIRDFVARVKESQQ